MNEWKEATKFMRKLWEEELWIPKYSHGQDIADKQAKNTEKCRVYTDYKRQFNAP